MIISVTERMHLGAFAQSGATMMNFINSGWSTTDTMRTICGYVNENASRTRYGCDRNSSVSDIMTSLKTAEPSNMFSSGLGANNAEFLWGPVRQDGIFYQENAWERYKRGDLNSNFEASS